MKDNTSRIMNILDTWPGIQAPSVFPAFGIGKGRRQRFVAHSHRRIAWIGDWWYNMCREWNKREDYLVEWKSQKENARIVVAGWNNSSMDCFTVNAVSVIPRSRDILKELRIWYFVWNIIPGIRSREDSYKYAGRMRGNHDNKWNLPPL